MARYRQTGTADPKPHADGRRPAYFPLTDTALEKADKVGPWTKADAQTYFAVLRVSRPEP